MRQTGLFLFGPFLSDLMPWALIYNNQPSNHKIKQVILNQIRKIILNFEQKQWNQILPTINILVQLCLTFSNQHLSFQSAFNNVISSFKCHPSTPRHPPPHPPPSTPPTHLHLPKHRPTPLQHLLRSQPLSNDSNPSLATYPSTNNKSTLQQQQIIHWQLRS